MTQPRQTCNRRSFLTTTAALAGSSFLSPIFQGKIPAAASPTVTPKDLEFSSALEAARAIRNRDVSSVELTRHILARIEKHNPKINAIVTLTADKALARARAADEALAKDEWWGPLHGVPITVKDSFEIEGIVTTAGVPSLADHVPARDSVAVQRLRGAGTVILGHKNVPFMLGDWQSYN